MKNHGENLMKKRVVKKEMILVENMEDLAKNLNKIMEDLANNLNKVMENMAKDHHFKVVIITTMIMVSEFLLSTAQEIPFLRVKTNLQYLISVV
jgi:hypothetical protein